ncbi:hypothetical protein EV421DRAFT_1904199 [Armillaria borealis]|uniref:Mitochondrial carrier n=1 Tax=Armillaria borealis TaxID=47425 RepID=A0AA39JHT5_9AGAR|nr:hypothetical protein EV421DRAFT_1904193 [Armillaria borealis]KAK0442422.1 hypothetical protein EV421DRAFT_1904196 [Armillaria borealis]KAK0442425.1 hypothetical protein EV421DRAFT_1904199 [Armillaria borealis]
MSEVGLDPLLDFFAGTISGIAGLVVGYPFDTGNLTWNPEMTGKYRSTMHALATIIKEERFIGMYKGITSPLTNAALMNGLVFVLVRTACPVWVSPSSAFGPPILVLRLASHKPPSLP